MASGCGDTRTTPVAQWTLHAPDGEPRALELPARFGDALPDRDSRYELRTTVTIPDDWDRGNLSLSIPHQAGQIRLTADGVEQRPLALEFDPDFRSTGQHIWPLDDAVVADGVVDLVLSVEHRWAQSAWFDTVPRLATAPDGDATTVAVGAVNRWGAYVSMGMLLAVLFAYLVLGVVARSRTYALYAFQALVALFYPLYVLGMTRFVGPLESPMLGMTLGLAVVSLLYSSNAAFGLTVHRTFWPGFTVAYVAMGLGTSNPYFSSYIFGPTTIVYLFVILTYEIYRLARLLKRNPRPTTLLPNMLAMVFVTVLSTPDIPMWIGLGEPFAGVRMVPLGLAMFTLLHMIAISAETLTTMRQAQQQRQEIESLNTELRRQVAERSKQLGEALGRLASHSGLAKDLAPGEVINERYRIVSKLGDGAMGVVYQCERVSDGRPLALKVLKTTTDASAMARFAREAQLASEIRSDQVVGILDVDFAMSGFMYLVMELVEGTTVRACKDKYRDSTWACHVLGEVASGLATIHQHGVIHRDLKPANVLLEGDGHGANPAVKITDFGISGIAEDLERSATGSVNTVPTLALLHAQSDIATMSVALDHSRASAPSQALTKDAWFLGTPAYMAPELATPAVGASAATDAFSFGVMAYEMLCGERPFNEPPVVMLASGMHLEAPPSVLLSNPAVPERVAAIVARCLDFNSDNRPTADELTAAFGARAPRRTSASGHAGAVAG